MTGQSVVSPSVWRSFQTSPRLSCFPVLPILTVVIGYRAINEFKELDGFSFAMIDKSVVSSKKDLEDSMIQAIGLP